MSNATSAWIDALNRHRLQLYALVAVNLLLLPCIVVANVLTIRCIQWSDELKKRQVFAIARILSFSDAVACLTFHPAQVLFPLYTQFSHRLAPHWLVCRLSMAVGMPPFLTSPSVQLFIAINRFVAVFLPFSYMEVFTLERVPLYYALACLPMTVLIWLGLARLWGDFYVYPSGWCTSVVSSHAAWNAAMGMVAVGPSLLTILAYICIFLRIRYAKTVASKKEVASRARGSLMMFVYAVVYLALSMPAPVIATTVGERFEEYGYVLGWVSVLFELTHGLNVLLFYALNETFRKQFRTYLATLRGTVTPDTVQENLATTSTRAITVASTSNNRAGPENRLQLAQSVSER